MLLSCSCHAVVATSKKNACVSLVFSFLYKVVQVSQATGAMRGISQLALKYIPTSQPPESCSIPREF